MTPAEYLPIVRSALTEDLADIGDLTSEAVIPAESKSEATIVARVGGVIAGVEVAAAVFEQVDPSVRTELCADGAVVEEGDSVGEVSGPSRSLLTAERTALNLLARMSGVATATAMYVASIEGTGAQIMDTRKTMPGLRVLDKYAVTVGGGVNHRMGLYDAMMIKDNHIMAAGDIASAVAAARAAAGAVEIVVEVEDLDQLDQVLETDADRVLLDNMSLVMLRAAVEACAGVMPTEASGGVNLSTVRAIAETGVDFISVGAITHSAPQLDIALDFV